MLLELDFDVNFSLLRLLLFLSDLKSTIFYLGEYSKSLKLLGVDVPSNRKQATILTHHMVIII